MSPFDILMLAFQLMRPLSLILGLWIAARWLPDLNELLSGIGARSATASRAGQVMLWIALGVLFGSPIADWLGAFGTLMAAVVRPAGDPGTMSTVWGQGSFSVYSGISTFMTLAIYLL